jgi:Zn-dependent protease
MKIKIGTIKGIEIKLHISTLLIVALVGYYTASVYYDIYPGFAPIWELILIGVLSGVAILFSILSHEIMHSLMAQYLGIKVPEIELYVFGGASKISEEPRTPKEEVLISVVGPISSLILGGILLLFSVLSLTSSLFLFVLLFYLGFTNVFLGLFNLIPAFPMDGGRILRAFLWRRRNNLLSATKTASRVGKFFGYFLMVFGIFELLFLGFIDGIWLILVGSLLTSYARQSYIQTIYQVKLSGLKAKDISGISKLLISYYDTIEIAVKKYFVPFQRLFFPVELSGEIVGIIHLNDIKKVPYNQRSKVLIGDIMRKTEELPSIDGDQTGRDALQVLNKTENQLHVIAVKEGDNGLIVGFIGEEELKYSLGLFTAKVEET